MKKYIICISIIILIVLVLVGLFITNDKEVNYEMKIEIIDEYSPDRTIKIFKNGKEFNDYNYIKYKDSNEVLCYSDNPIVNLYELDSDEYLIVLNDKKEISIKISR